ncbi:hydroxyisourate hydrolase [Pseudomonas putida]|uniref:hydroxyisourate hydrolase n=1 Tax=Pseudomonas putida TaxID=303 RepID=A0A1X0ZYP8_PSEPU|nr:hydroxyisourate hydrolase [Pseudomonas putida]MEB3899192.1 hydroxyisourate hydrolase [Pseudomonas putida]ORL64722.1 hydroxyisourate hydrolase [Pseudomonas putida]
MNDPIAPNRRQFVMGTLALAGGLLVARQGLAGTANPQPAQAAGPISLHGVSPRLTIHILDTYSGSAATGLQVEFSRMEQDRPVLLQTLVINQNGRTEAPLLIDDSYQAGNYQLLLHIDDYFRMKGARLPSPTFLSKVPIRFAINDTAERLHLPVQFGPWNYGYYRGS